MKRILSYVIVSVWMCLAGGCGRSRLCLPDSQATEIRQLVEAEIAKQNFPGAVILVGQGDAIQYCEAFGSRTLVPDTQPMTRGTILDLASLTKPLATAACVMILMDQGRLDPNDTVATYLPVFSAHGKDSVQLQHLLTHTSGLPAYLSAKSLEDQYGSPCPDAVIQSICQCKPFTEPGDTFRYSCLGYILLARIVETVSGESIDAFSHEHLYQPLGMTHTTFNPPNAWAKKIAPTEIVNGQPLCGTVHDPLARLMGGVSGNAGLFSTAEDMAKLCQMFLQGGCYNGHTILSHKAVTLMTTPQIQGRGFGFDVQSSYAWLKGEYASEESFCHSGYTGTSIVCNPKTKRYVIILTNRVHPQDKGSVKVLRLGVADIVFGKDMQ